MARLGTRVIVALLAEWFCHKLDPAWKYKRAQRRAYLRIKTFLSAAQKPVEELFLAVSETAESFRALADREIEERDG